MVRFIMACFFPLLLLVSLIYIPIWLDLLWFGAVWNTVSVINLHSNMVRFIILTLNLLNDGFKVFTFQYG